MIGTLARGERDASAFARPASIEQCSIGRYSDEWKISDRMDKYVLEHGDWMYKRYKRL